jgi:hypothetical protein
MTNTDQDIVYTLRAVPIKTQAQPKPPGEAMTIDADRFGNVLFREEPVPIPLAKLDDGLTKCLAVARSILTKASDIAAGYEVDSITLKLALDAGVGVVFVGDAKIEAAIEVEVKKKKA